MDAREAVQGERRPLNKGFDKGLTTAFELTLTPAIFGAIGYALDRWMGTVPLWTILLVLVAFAGVFVKLWYAYDAEMQAHDANATWKRGVPGASRRSAR